jgi:hypothetical protein
MEKPRPWSPTDGGLERVNIQFAKIEDHACDEKRMLMSRWLSFEPPDATMQWQKPAPDPHSLDPISSPLRGGPPLSNTIAWASLG